MSAWLSHCRRRQCLLQFVECLRLVSRRTNETAMLALVMICVLLIVDLPRVTGLPPRVYLARGLTGHIDCPVDANPPVTIILWAKNGVMVDDDDDGPRLIGSTSGSHRRRLRISRQGTLLIRSVQMSDEGRYVCTPYSPLGKGQTSMPVQVFVRGQSLSYQKLNCLLITLSSLYAFCLSHFHGSVESLKHSYLDSLIPLFCFSFLVMVLAVFYSASA